MKIADFVVGLGKMLKRFLTCSVEKLAQLVFSAAIPLSGIVCAHLSYMSKTTKSPKAIAAAAYRVARDTLPEHFSPYSPKKFTQPQLLVCLVLKTFFDTDYRGIVQILDDCPSLCKVFELKTVPHFTTLQKASRRLLKTYNTQKILERTVKIGLGKRKTVKLAAMDSTGLEARHISRYFVKRRSREPNLYQTTTYRRWPKLAIVCDCSNHLILSAITIRGPSPDINQFCKTLKPCVEKFRIKQLLADAGYDSEANHTYAREVHQIKTTIPPKHGRPTTKLPKTKYRKEMRTDFDKETYGQRWQSETVFSMIKRNYTDSLSARSYWSQCRDMILLVLTHNLGIILLVKELFYRACQEPFSTP